MIGAIPIKFKKPRYEWGFLFYNDTTIFINCNKMRYVNNFFQTRTNYLYQKLTRTGIVIATTGYKNCFETKTYIKEIINETNSKEPNQNC